ncbi:hypothetical protein D3C78_1826110 [compost metagenome]
MAEPVEQGGLGPGIDLLATHHELQAVEKAWHLPWPMVHLQRKAQQHEGIADHGRIEQIAAHPAEGMLANAEGNARGDHRQPPGGQAR